MQMKHQQIAWKTKTLVAALLAMLMAIGGGADNARAGATEAGLDLAVRSATGVDPNDYPCAKEGIVTLFKNRQEISNLSTFHPKRIFTWMLDTTVYFTNKVIGFFRGLMNPAAVENGIKRIMSMARSGNPLGSATRAVDGAVANMDGWVNSLSRRTQSVLTGKVHGIIENTTNNDGSCKKK